MAESPVRQRVLAYFESMSAMRAQRWVENFAKDALIYDPVGSPPKLAHRDAERFFELLNRMYATLEVSPQHIYICGDAAAVNWTMRVVLNSGMVGKADGISVFEMNTSGKIQKLFSYWDEAALMKQLQG